MPFHSRRVTTVSAVLGATLLTACADAPLTGPNAVERSLQLRRSEDVRAAISAKNRHGARLHGIRGVVGTAVGLRASGEAAIQVLVVDNTPRDIPTRLDDVPVDVQVTGMLVALSDPTTRLRPAPLGYSIGHPAITAGTIGARVTNGAQVFVLSNNHVLANANDAAIGDATLQPGTFDGGTSADEIGTLHAFAPIDFNGGNNWIDAAIALSSTANLANSTPLDDGYGTPNSQIFGDANNDRSFDNPNALLNVQVKKYGRTTKLTVGTITGINATVDICYEVLIIFCVKSARFVDQIIITPGGFSGGGDSGSLIVTNNSDANPVGLLFAGSSAQTIANRIDHVLNWFNVNVDGSASEPPPDLNDVAVVGVNAPANVTQGATVNVSVTVRNVGNQPVAVPVVISLRDETAGADIGAPQSVDEGLAVGASATRTFVWATTSSTTLGAHTLRGAHNFDDEIAANNSATTTSNVNAVSTNTIHIGDLDGSASGSRRWDAIADITVHDSNHQPLNGARILGTWTPAGLNSNDCTSGELGGIGTCIMLYPSIARNRQFVTLTINSVTMAGRSYQQSANHDPDGSSNGTTIRINRP